MHWHTHGILGRTAVAGALLAVLGVGIGVSTLIGGPRATQAQQSDTAGPPTITVVSVGEIRVTPDRATVRVGVEEQADSAATAIDAVNQKVAAVVNALKALGIPDTAMQTANLSVYPDNSPVGPGMPATSRFTTVMPMPNTSLLSWS